MNERSKMIYNDYIFKRLNIKSNSINYDKFGKKTNIKQNNLFHRFMS